MDSSKNSKCAECHGRKKHWWYVFCSAVCAHRSAAKAYQKRHKQAGQCNRCPRRARKGFATCRKHAESQLKKAA